MSAIDEIKDRLDVVDVVGESVKLRKSGKNYTGFCPFHPNTRTPAFVVFPESGTWRCFGACNEGGDIFSFVMKREGWDFPEALRNLAERAGVELKPRTPEEREAEDVHQRLRETLEAAVTFYRHNLLHAQAGEQVRDYLHGRGLRDDTLESFEIGYAPKSWDATMRYLLDKGFSEEELMQSGMISERESGGFYDRFRHRIMIPIRDGRGRMAGFGARVVDPEEVPKFLNSPQTAIFDKGRLLFGLDKARKAIRATNHAVIVEGYMDVIALHQAGFANAVSPMGTALTESQLRYLKRFSRSMILALDADAAGDQATLRGLTLARDALDREMDPVFDARGLVRHEGRLDAEIRVVKLPEGKDPDEVVAEDAAVWEGLVSQAQSVVDYVMEVLISGKDVEDSKIKGEIARQVLPLIEDVADPVERESYRQTLARRLKVDERALLGWRPKGRRARPSRRARRKADAAPVATTSVATKTVVERFCLGLLLRDPELLYRVDRPLVGLGLPRLSAQDFTGSERRVIFQVVRECLAQDDMEPVRYWRSKLDLPLVEQADSLLEEVSDIDLSRPKVVEGVIASFMRLRKRSLDSALTHLQFQLQALQEGLEGEGGTERQSVEDLTREVLKLGPQKDRLEAIARRHEGPVKSSVSEER
jgi:DNA primase